MRTIKRLPVSEVFYSIQGEGITAGIPAIFVRLGGCNLMCGGRGTHQDKQLHNGATWRCDTLEVWTRWLSTPVPDILSDEYLQLFDREGYRPHLVITGGEPLLHTDNLDAFLRSIPEDIYIEVETNGTIIPTHYQAERVDQWNISPKLRNSGNETKARYRPKVLRWFMDYPCVFKFVISSDQDLNEIEEEYPFIPGEMITLMPAGENQSELDVTRTKVLQMCIQGGYRFSDRLHIVAWNKKTGV